MRIYLRPAKAEIGTPAPVSLIEKARENRRAALAVLRTRQSVSPVALSARERRAGLEAPLMFVSNRNAAPANVAGEASRSAA
ncbi:hypothetical protein PSA7680_00248 [Pseudoruegeria aquimaris]|uniref:Uncharacterized protein n=1 Tax=Pseudoruegeria aquimaris TaxID=393663 RepID=A0A1Y5RB43_9RHOB|nr:hypothetical protein [Pseudoruegeria aquimaris]SLN13208.1 hypothetical protein PSA7680_00248 [Pseudoruegeria aquimaris]